MLASLCNFRPPYSPVYIVKVMFNTGIHYICFLFLKTKLADVLVRTASKRLFILYLDYLFPVLVLTAGFGFFLN